MDCEFISTPCRLNKKLDLIRRTSPEQSPKEYNYICNTLDSSINQLETQFRYLRQASSPVNNDNLSHSYSVNCSMISPRTLFQKRKTPIMYSASSMNKNINNKTYLMNYAQKSEILQRQLEEKNRLINEYEDMFIVTLDKIKKLKEENARMKMELGLNMPSKYNSNVYKKADKEDVQYVKKKCKKIKKEQDKCDRNVDELYCLTTSMNNENYKMNRRDEKNRWEKMRKMNEELQLASKENKNKELTSQTKVNQLKLQIQKLQEELSSYKQYE